ncbi:MAG: hypothetical protein JXD21_03365 [Candidatus Omnitrophica bacterium]|nr:hypothetical protein [Candidatus Omnitrophota bacterium]
MGRNLPLIILLILLIVSGFIALKFYTDAQQLYTEKQNLVNENTELLNENRSLKKHKERLEKESKEFEQRWREVLQELSEAERKLKDDDARYQQVRKERDILEKKLKEGPKVVVTEKPQAKQEDKALPEHWESVVRAKAELEAQLEGLNKELLDTRAKIAELDKNNKELSIKIDELTKVKERLEKDAEFKERTMQIMSKDLVNEREKRQALDKEVGKLRDDNIGLKQEMILANKEKSRLQNNLKNALETRQDLERKVSEIEKVLKEKSLLFEQLKDELVDTLQVSEDIAASSSVTLPPIVVEQKPQVKMQPDVGAVATGIMQGNVLAVNQKERFVIIDLGADAGVNTGDVFEVYRGNRFIGLVEVIETRREVSAADIKSGSAIVENDTVISK